MYMIVILITYIYIYLLKNNIVTCNFSTLLNVFMHVFLNVTTEGSSCLALPSYSVGVHLRQPHGRSKLHMHVFGILGYVSIFWTL